MSVQTAVKCSTVGCGATGWSVPQPGSMEPKFTCINCTYKKLNTELYTYVTHLCEVDVRNRPEQQPTLCGIREPVGSWNPPHKTDLSARGICPKCVAAFQETKTKGQNVQHIIALQNSRTALCGLSRDRIVQSGDGGICPDCKEVDKHIQQAIGYLADPIVKGPFQRLLNQFSKPETAAGLAAAAATKGIEQKMDYKTSAVKALKRGAAAGTMKVVSKKIKAKLTEKFPQLAMVPDNIWNVVLCLAINMVASSSPDIPGIRMAEQLSSEAFEGLLTDATSKMVQDVIETVSETFVELAEDRKHKGLLGCEE